MAYPFTYPSYQNQNQNYGNFNQQVTPIPQVPQQNNGIIWVQGEAGARAYLVAPNSTVQLWDSEAHVIYLKSADASGMPTIKILDYTIRDNNNNKNVSVSEKMPQTDNFATKEDIYALKNEINEIRDKIKPKKTIKKGDSDE